MSKKIIITTIIIVIAVIAVFFLFFYKGSLTIHPLVSPVNITVNKKAYKDKDSLSVKLTPGQYKIKVEKAGYVPYEETIKISFLKEKDIFPILETTNKAKNKDEIEKISKEFIQNWYTYDTQTNINYLEKIKPYMTQEFYETIYYVNTNRPQDFENEVPLKSTVFSLNIFNYAENETRVKVGVQSTESTTGKTYRHQTILELVKENNKWLVNYLEPYYLSPKEGE